MSCICKYVFLNYSGPNSVRFSWDWAWWLWGGAQRAVAAAMDQLCRWPWLYKLLSAPQTLWLLCLFQALLLYSGWEFFPLQKPLKSWRSVLSLLLGSLTQPRAADFAKSIENTDLQCTVGVAEGAGVLFPEALPALKNWNVTNRPLLFFGEVLSCWLCLYLVVV